MSEDLDFLVDLLDLEPIEVNIFRGVSPNEERQRVFGGQVAAQSLMAAGRTVEIGRPHSLHAYFLRPGDPTRAHPLRGRPHPGRSVVHHPAGGGHPARAGHLQPVGLLPRRRARSDPPDPHARCARRRRPSTRWPPGWSPTGRPWATGSPNPIPSSSATSASSPSATTPARTRPSDSGSAPTAPCRTIRSSTPASSPMPRTCPCSTPCWPPTT